MPNDALAREFCNELETLELKVSIDRQNAGERFQDIAGETKDWLWRTGHPLNAFADILWNISRYDEHGQADVSEWLSDALTRWGIKLLNSPAIASRTSLRAFVQRAQGRTSRTDRAFGGTRRPTASKTSRGLWRTGIRPHCRREAVVIGDPTGMRLRLLWQAAKRSGYRVLENWAFKDAPNEEAWFCTVGATNRG